MYKSEEMGLFHSSHLTLRCQAIEELNIKQKYWKDLLTDEPFSRKDIIHLQDPLNLAVSLFFRTNAGSADKCYQLHYLVQFKLQMQLRL